MMGDLRIPDRLGEVSGWRAWQIVGTLATPRLMSVNAAGRVGHDDAIWPTNRWFYARCPKGHTTDIPVEPGCSCGLYAARDRDHLIKLAYGAYGEGQLMAVGEVAFAGKIVQGKQGWRAEKGRIKSLVVPYEHWAYAEPLSEAYNIPVEVGFLFSPQTRQKVRETERREAQAAAERRRKDALLNDQRRRLDDIANDKEDE